MDKLKEHRLFLFFFTGLALFYFWGISLVPFHPDESTQIYMSQDFAVYFKDPFSIAYRPDEHITPEISLRAIDAPLTKYLIGFSHFLFNIPAQEADWDWSVDWETNKSNGALPTQSQLYFARLFPTVLTLASVLICYFSFTKLLPKYLAFLTTAYLGLNPLMLLHGRRAMAEPALIFGISLFLLIITKQNQNPVHLGLVLALAINSKQSAIVCLPVAIIAIYRSHIANNRLIKTLVQTGLMILTIGVIWFILNPFFWVYPIKSLQISLDTRSALSAAHLATHLGGQAPPFIIRIIAAFSNLFINGLAFTEVNNLPPYQITDINVYQSIFLHDWGRNLYLGSLLISVMFFGIYTFLRYTEQSSKDKIALFYGLLILLGSFTLISLPIPWQRYILPLLPMTTLSIGLGLSPLFNIAFTSNNN
jgi:4-amino-4-deoxy-L-arabinose transferase-like glycosyltransferase